MKKLASYEYVDMVPAAPLRKLAFSSFRNGSLAGFILRPSTSTDTKTVLDSVFSCSGSAAAFARRWASNIEYLVKIRPIAFLGLSGWRVSVPVFHIDLDQLDRGDSVCAARIRKLSDIPHFLSEFE